MGTILKLYRVSNYSKCVCLIIQQCKGVVTQIFFSNGLMEYFVSIFICNKFFIRVKIKCNWKAFWTIKTINISIPSNSTFKSASYAIKNIGHFLCYLGRCLNSWQAAGGRDYGSSTLLPLPGEQRGKLTLTECGQKLSQLAMSYAMRLSWISWVVFPK